MLKYVDIGVVVGTVGKHQLDRALNPIGVLTSELLGGKTRSLADTGGFRWVFSGEAVESLVAPISRYIR